jgi:hypothetical protein
VPAGPDTYIIDNVEIISSYNLTVNGNLKISPPLGDLRLQNNSTITIDGGTVTLEEQPGGTYIRNSYQTNADTGVITITNGGTLNIENEAVLYNGQAMGTQSGTTANLIVSNGTVNINSGGYIINGRAPASSDITGTIEITSGGTLNINSGGIIQNGYADSLPSTAALQLNGGILNLNTGGSIENGVGTAIGTISLNQGTFRFGNANISELTAASLFFLFGASIDATDFGGTDYYMYNGAVTIPSAQTATIQSGSTINVNSGGALTVEGMLSSNGTIINNGSLSCVGTLRMQSGSINNGDTAAGTIVSSGTFQMDSGTLTNGQNSTGNITLSDCNITLNGGNLQKGASTSNVTIFGANLNGVAAPISNGVLTLASGTMTIPATRTFSLGGGGGLLIQGSNLSISGNLNNSGAVFVNSTGTFINNNALTNNLSLVVAKGGSFTNNATFNNNGAFLDFNNAEVVVQPNTIAIIPSGATIDTASNDKTYIRGNFRNLSSNSINVFGTMYTYSLMENGGATAGTINVKPDGLFYLLNGTVENNHADSEINVETGGSFYNYYGTVDLTTGGADSLNVSAGAKFHNVRGNDPGTFTISAGGNFSDSNKILLDQNLDIDYTWTITENAAINGFGKTITFGTNGKIFIETNAALLLQDVKLKNISANKIDFADNKSTLSIDNVVWNQDANFSLTRGKIYVSGDWVISGNGTEFSYETDWTSTVTLNSSIILDNTTFKYNETTNNLLYLEDKTSTIHLNHATLQAAQALTLANGTLVVTGLGKLQGTAKLDLQNLDSINIYGGLEKTGNVVL